MQKNTNKSGADHPLPASGGSAKWREWIIDVTEWPRYCFCPYEADTESVVTGMNVICDRSPGALTGVYHCGGSDFAQTWVNENPGWLARYSPNDQAKTLR